MNDSNAKGGILVSIADKRNKSFFIQPADLVGRLETSEAATIVDVRNPQPWDRSDIKIRGAIRIDPEQLRLDPAWPKSKLLVFY